MMKIENSVDGQLDGSQDEVNIKDLFIACLSRWRWFVISVVITVSLAVLYILIKQPVYTRTASVLVKNDSKGGSISSDISDAFSNFGVFQSGTNVNNELIVFKSPALIADVIRRLELDINYSISGFFQDTVAYGSKQPVKVVFRDFSPNEGGSFEMKIGKDGVMELSGFTRGKDDFDDKVTTSFSDSVVTPIGLLSILPTPYFQSGRTYSIDVAKWPMYVAIEYYTNTLNVVRKDKNADVLELSFEDCSIERAEQLLSTLIAVYNERWLEDKNQVAVSSSLFITERLKLIESELGTVDDDISEYKSSNLIPDVEAVSKMYMDQSSDLNNQIIGLTNQLYMTRFIREYLANDANIEQLLPANCGIQSASIENQISEYNAKILSRNSLVANSGDRNPLVADLNKAIAALRAAIITSVDNQLITIQTQIDNLRKIESQNKSRIADSPSQAKYLMSIERQRKVKESLYLFLLQKREENELSLAFLVYNIRIITPPSGSMKPTSPIRRNILVIAFMLGLLIPVGIVFLLISSNTTIRGRKDIEQVKVPLIGEIPLNFSKRKIIGKRKTDNSDIVVRRGNRNIINEAFRVLRTNFEFMSDGSSRHNVMAITSFNPGSGKSFITINLAICMAIKDKRVLVIDGDMRHASTSEYVSNPVHGLSDYLSGRETDISKLLTKIPKYPMLDVLPVGVIPPNPSELLYDGHLQELIEKVRPQYDYILIDCPPVEIVADTDIIERLSDRTIFVIRVGLFERSMLPQLDKLYSENKYKKMNLILNGASSESGRYGNKYGYGYGYYKGSANGYYGNNDDSDDDEY